MMYEDKWLVMIVYPDKPDLDYSTREYFLSDVAEIVREKIGVDLTPHIATAAFRRMMRAEATWYWDSDDRRVCVVVMTGTRLTAAPTNGVRRLWLPTTQQEVAMTDGNLSPERQRELLAAIGVSVEPEYERGLWNVRRVGFIHTPECDTWSREQYAWSFAWRIWGQDALAHALNAQAARIASLEAEVAALREQAAAPKRVLEYLVSDIDQYAGDTVCYMTISEDGPPSPKRPYTTLGDVWTAIGQKPLWSGMTGGAP